MKNLKDIAPLALALSLTLGLSSVVQAKLNVTKGCPRIVGHYECSYENSNGTRNEFDVYLDTRTASKGTVEFQDLQVTLGKTEMKLLKDGAKDPLGRPNNEWLETTYMCSQWRMAFVESLVEKWGAPRDTDHFIARQSLSEYALEEGNQLVVKTYHSCSLEYPCEGREPTNVARCQLQN